MFKQRQKRTKNATEKPKLPQQETDEKQPEELSAKGGADEHQVYLNVTKEFEAAKKKRNSYKTYGPLVVIISGILLLTLMFTLEHKIIFLILWVVTDLYTVALMIRAEYRYHQFGQILGLIEPTEEDAAEGEERV